VQEAEEVAGAKAEGAEAEEVEEALRRDRPSCRSRRASGHRADNS
jgi:hypothetical protein